MTRPLELSLYDASWPERYEALARDVQRACGKRLVALEHIGSTAVPGLLAKPVIDIGAAVMSEADADACVDKLRRKGWEYRGQHGDDPARRYYVLERDGRRLAQLHLWILPAEGWRLHIAFRDRLRADPALREAYAAEKLRLLVTRAGDRLAYSESKGAFIATALAE